MKTCRKCKKQKELSDFRTNNTKHGYYQTCKGCLKSSTSPYSYWKHGLKKKYGVTPEWYFAKLDEQDGCCAICGTSHPGAGKNYFCVDHNHSDGSIRGLLCSNCNIGIGNLQDSVSLLLAAATYLNDYSTLFDVRSPHVTKQRCQKNVERADKSS